MTINQKIDALKAKGHYRTEALAAKLAARLDQDEYESSFGEVSYWAGPVADSTYQARYAVGQKYWYTEEIF